MNATTRTIACLKRIVALDANRLDVMCGSLWADINTEMLIIGVDTIVI